MTARPVCATLHQSVDDALGMMRRGGFHHLPVLDPAGGVVGVVTHCDLIHPPSSRGYGPADGARRLADVSIGPAVTVPPETPLVQGGRYLLPDPLSCLLVVDAGGALRGILTTRDVLGVLLGLAARP